MRGDWLPVIQRAVDDADGRWSSEQLLADVAEGRVHVWIVTDGERVKACFTTRVVEAPSRWVLIQECAGDDMESWLALALQLIEQWARSHGAQQIVAEGRLGWQKALQPYGYAPRLITCVKHLQTLN